MSDAARLAHARVVGEDVEDLVADRVDGLELVPDDAVDWYDAVAVSLVTPADIRMAGIALVERDTEIEVKATHETISNGARPDRPGRWWFKGGEDGQHARLVDAAAMYVLVVYRDTPDDRHIRAIILVPASIVDEHLRNRWYDSGRREGRVAQLPWTALLEGGASQ